MQITVSQHKNVGSLNAICAEVQTTWTKLKAGNTHWFISMSLTISSVTNAQLLKLLQPGTKTIVRLCLLFLPLYEIDLHKHV